MELLQLKYFCHAAETQNFSQTAKYFSVPVSNISQTIKRLETELNTKLFYRESNSLYLNENGEVFYSYAKKALELLEEAQKRFNENEELCGDIKIHILTNRHIVTEYIERFKKEFPKVNFLIKHTLEEKEDFDILISDVCPYVNTQRSLLVDEKMMLAVNNELIVDKNKFTLEDYKDSRFIAMQPTSSLYRHTKAICNFYGFEPNIAIQTDDPFYVRKYLELGLGVAIIPNLSWDGLLAKNISLFEIDRFERKTYVWWKNKYLPSRVRAFIEYMTIKK